MMFVEASETEQKSWDALVKKTNGSVFSESRYLNAVSESWGILYNDTRTGGMVCPYSVKAGQRILHSPIFFRYSEWLGEGSLNEDALQELKKLFPVAQLNVREGVPTSIQRIHQVVDANSYKLNQLAKRSLKKSENYIISSQDSISELSSLIERELIPRIHSLKTNSIVELSALVSSFQGSGLRSYSVFEKDQFSGGLWVLENETTHLYLKGTCTEVAKKNGAMFLLMNTAILTCLETGKTFDFGGSNAENVKRFNYHFGAQDCVYSQLEWNTAPFWWKGIKRLRSVWKSK